MKFVRCSLHYVDTKVRRRLKHGGSEDSHVDIDRLFGCQFWFSFSNSFRGNLVVRGSLLFAEDHWTDVTIGGIVCVCFIETTECGRSLM